MNDARATSPRLSKALLAAVFACLTALVIGALVARAQIDDVVDTALFADVEVYEDIGRAILDGGVPYLDVPVEHLPIAVIPIVVLTALADAVGANLYPIWVIAMSCSFVASAVFFDRIGSGFRFVLVALPVLPLVLFRVEPLVVLFAVAAIAAFAVDRYRTGGLWTVFGSLTKGWPIVLASIPWARGKRRVALTTVGTAAALLIVVLATPGFREAREFSGIHSETVIGSLLLAARQIVGSDLGLIGTAGAVYVASGVWAIIINAIPGLATIGASALALARLGATSDRRSTFDTAVSVSGLAVLGIMLTSPLLSTQFLFWLVPFIALERRSVAVPYIIGAVAGLFTVTVFSPTAVWWAGVVVAKNIAILALAWRWATLLLTTSPVADGTDLSAGHP